MKRTWRNLWNTVTGTTGRKHRSRQRPLKFEALERRELLTVTWSMDPRTNTLKLIGDSANDWISVEVSGQTVYFSGTNLKNSIGQPTPNPQSMLAASIAAIDMAGGEKNMPTGTDTFQFKQSGDFQKQVRMYGQDGNDTFSVTFTSGKQARVSAEGGPDIDTANIPANIGCGSFWTDAEKGTFGTYVGHASPSLRVTPFVTSVSTNRSSDLYTRVIQQFAVQTKTRYINPNNPLCNIFAWDVTSAMGAEIPHWTFSDGRPAEPDPKGVTGAKEMKVNPTVDWLKDYGATYGWYKLNGLNSAEDAQAKANNGRPTIAIWKNPTAGAHGHIAVVRPTTNPFDSTKGPAIAQAGGLNGSGNIENTTVKTGFNVGGTGPKNLSEVIYYYHD